MGDGFELTANRVDLLSGRIAPERITVRDGVIQSIESVPNARQFVVPGLVDAHVHIESSMLLPSEFARAAVVHGTVATVSDPHEIANVCGIEGIELMLRNAAGTPFQFCFGAPSCVPATAFETSGARLDLAEIERLLDDPRIGYLSEVMNFPGVIAGQPDVLEKIDAARDRGLPVDGHAPGLRGEELVRYLNAGITTDHETLCLEEGREKIAHGCRVAIREGSAAKNFEALWPLIDEHPDACMFCSDDKHPDALLSGHINELVARALAKGCDVINTLRVASLNPAKHYGLALGMLQLGDPADFIVLDSLEHFQPRATFIRGQRVAVDGHVALPQVSTPSLNQFAAAAIPTDALRVAADSDAMRVIDVRDGQLLTDESITQVEPGLVISNVQRDILKLVVVNRYQPAAPSVAFVRGFGLSHGALASSVAHDSHNIVAVGVEDHHLATAVNAVIERRGGLAVSAGDDVDVLPLPIAGLMSHESCAQVASTYSRMDRLVKALGSPLQAPWMTLSFLALLVIPKLKLSDLGLFDVDRFQFTGLFTGEKTSTT